MKAQFLEFKENQNQCLININLLHIKFDAISESLSSLMKNVSNTNVKPTSFSCEPIPILKLLPMDSEGLIQGEEWLQTEQNRQNLVVELSKIGGPTPKEVMKRVMYRLFENSLGMEYSWEGKKKEKKFLNHFLFLQ
ncbi:PREDICTED: uncharacterized protein LOC108764803 [Trachymyrmex cornetzi]|uniref:uncharacterized protein LOC108764803 n=1 Tax=Trachymyrmex cornetzi TaxID=471704 RepID=UPI00084F5404|nr:PREDICTED: uncharacterized protein LOC108764803 [Trachymyrmex cornetzi]